MSLDLYCGSFAKFYSRDFETPQFRFCRENNMEYRLVIEGEPIDWFTPENAEERAEAFIRQLNTKLKDSNHPACEWDDSQQPYLTEQLFERSLNSLILVAAYSHRPDLRCPEHLPDDLEADQAYSESTLQKYYIGPMAILESHVFLPSTADALFFSESPIGFDISVTTTANLKFALKRLAEGRWKNSIDPESWFNRGPAPGGGKSYVEEKSLLPWRKKWREVQEHPPADSLSWDAEYAFGCISRLLQFSERTGLPILKDF